MHRLAVTAILCFTLVLSAHGLSVEIAVTPKRLDQGKYAFSISTNTTQDGMSFHVIITAKTGDIPSDSNVGLSIVTHWEPGGSQIMPEKPTIQVMLEKDNRTWEASFAVTRELLKKPGLCLVFTEYDGFVVNGKKHPNSATFYEIKLQDFLKQ